MTLSKEQFAKLVENYVSQIIEGLDIDSMESMLFDVLTREYETYTEEQILSEIKDLYNEEYAQELLESVKWHKPFTLDSLMRIKFQKRFPFTLS